MELLKGNLQNVLIAESHSNYSLDGMVSPTFQNEGTATVFVMGRKIEPGQSYSVNAPNIVLQNSIPITFELNETKTRILYLGFVEVIQ